MRSRGTKRRLVKKTFLEGILTSRWVGMFRRWWVGRMIGRLVIGRLGEFGMLVARLYQW